MKIKLYSDWLNETNTMPVYLSNEEIEKLFPELDDQIHEWIDMEVATFNTEDCESEKEGEALQYFIENARILTYYRIYPADGSITVVAKIAGGSNTDKDFQVEWEDENGEDHATNAFNQFDFNVQHNFDDNAMSGEIVFDELPTEIEDVIKSHGFSNMTPEKWKTSQISKKFGL